MALFLLLYLFYFVSIYNKKLTVAILFILLKFIYFKFIKFILFLLIYCIKVYFILFILIYFIKF